MVYEVRCDECGELIDFGGHSPEDRPVGDESETPDDAIEFDGSVYCRDCVENFIKFGIGDVTDRLVELEDQMKDVREELGLEKSV